MSPPPKARCGVPHSAAFSSHCRSCQALMTTDMLKALQEIADVPSGELGEPINIAEAKMREIAERTLEEIG